jgi:hypothetical protein
MIRSGEYFSMICAVMCRMSCQKSAFINVPVADRNSFHAMALPLESQGNDRLLLSDQRSGRIGGSEA